MPVDFELRRVPAIPVAVIRRSGPWRVDHLRAEFRELTAWARRQGLASGRWIFSHSRDDRWEACLEVRGTRKAAGRIRLTTLPATWVARCVFDPDMIADRVIYHGLSDWTRERRRAKEIRSIGGSREVYVGDPWSDARAWAHCEVQFLVRR